MIGQGRRLLVVEDDGLTRSLLVDALTAQEFIVESVSNAQAALEAARSFDPDAALLDIDLGDGPSGLDLGHILHQTRPDIALIFLTKHPDGRTASVQVEDIPPDAAFLSKDRVRDLNYLTTAIDAALRDRSNEVRQDRDPERPFADLTDKQIDVLRLIALGYTNERIAQERRVGRTTVERWAKEIFEKLGINTAGDLNPRVEATRIFVESAGLPPR